MVRKLRASSRAVVSPTWRMPSALMKRSSPILRRARSPPSVFDHLVFVVFFALRLDRLAFAFLRAALGAYARAALGQTLLTLSGFSVSAKMSAGSFNRPFSWNSLDMVPPRPSMSNASRDDEMSEPLHGLGGADQPAGAAPVHILLAGLLVHFAHRMAAADRDICRGNL